MRTMLILCIFAFCAGIALACVMGYLWYHHLPDPPALKAVWGVILPITVMGVTTIATCMVLSCIPRPE